MVNAKMDTWSATVAVPRHQTLIPATFHLMTLSVSTQPETIPSKSATTRPLSSDGTSKPAVATVDILAARSFASSTSIVHPYARTSRTADSIRGITP